MFPPPNCQADISFINHPKIAPVQTRVYHQVIVGEWSLGGLGGGGVETATLMFARGGGGRGPAVA